MCQACHPVTVTGAYQQGFEQLFNSLCGQRPEGPETESFFSNIRPRRESRMKSELLFLRLVFEALRGREFGILGEGLGFFHLPFEVSAGIVQRSLGIAVELV